ncbi:glycosyltransferase family 9 protein [Galbibacter mesophilus]|uniref:glycosyltransferase family 9 protein n=1 Tax=Galbibacter mesophilus TaxID=379069 RepID=UPI00191FE05B|nr:glycosyltransferase family 9 protein [Galbibacter mesophilus]MCM5663504.1 glycosyltransferase family 9 protein [Galbibacter mesophilus]
MKVLIIQQKMIGDVLTSSLLCENLKKLHNDCTVHYMVHSHTIPVIAENPYIDVIIDFKPAYRKSKLELLKLTKRLNRENYDAIIDIYGKLETNIISLLVGAKMKIAYYKWYTKLIYSHPIKRLNHSINGKNYTIYNRLQLLEPLVASKEKKAFETKPSIYLTEIEKNDAIQFLESNNIDITKPIYMVSILGSSLSKSYPFQYMAQVIDQIANLECTILFNYIPSQIDDVRKIYNLCSPETKEKIAMDVFAPSLRKFIAILSSCEAIVGNEGGAINMAKALNIPSFAIFSPWIDKDEWASENSKTHQAVHLQDYHPELYRSKKYKTYKKDNTELYEKFLPELFTKKLRLFLNQLK